MIKEDFVLQDELFQLLIKEQVDSVAVNNCISKMGAIRRNAEWNNFTHFRKLLATCNPEQKTIFKARLKEVLYNMRGEGVRKPNETK